MWIELVIFAVISAVVWVLNIRCIRHGICERIRSEMYMHAGLGIYFTLLPLEMLFGHSGLWPRADDPLVMSIGFALYVPATVFVVGSFMAFHHHGQATAGDLTATTAFVDTGVFAIVREPMTLGMALFAIGLVLIGQSLVVLIPGLVAFACFYLSARTEAPHNIEKFGPVYREYMARVPMWNFFKGLKN